MAKEHVTKTNPTGFVSQCDRKEVHVGHEYQDQFGGYFNAYCLGIKSDAERAAELEERITRLEERFQNMLDVNNLWDGS